MIWFIEDLYDQIFVIPDDESLSQQAEEVGYESLYLTINSGSLSLYIALFFLKQFFFQGVEKIAPKNSKVSNLAASRSQNLFAKFTNMFNEFYICMAFVSGINAQAMSLETVSKGFNSVYTVVMIALLTAWPIYVTVKLALELKNLPKAASVLELAGVSSNANEINEGGEKEEEVKKVITAKTKKGKKRRKKMRKGPGKED